MDNSSAIADLEEQLKNLVPTPPVCWPVQFYLGGETREPRCGQVVAVEAPGQVSISVTNPNGMPHTERGCLHVTHPKEQVKHKNGRSQNDPGSWDYPPGATIPKCHFDAHREHLKRRIQLLRSEQERWEEAQEARRQRAEQVKEAAGAAV